MQDGKGRYHDRAPGCCSALALRGRRALGLAGMGTAASASWWAACCSPPSRHSVSIPTRSLGPLGCLCVPPTRKGLSHRSVLSHTVRAGHGLDALAYLRCWHLGLAGCCSFFRGPPPRSCWDWARALWREQSPAVLSAAGGRWSASSWLQT